MRVLENPMASGLLEFPTTVEGLTKEWLTAALSQRFPNTVVSSLKVVRVIWGTATKVLLTAEYAGDQGVVRPPRDLCVKACLDERVKGLADPSLFVREAGFYRDLAAQLAIPQPRTWYADSDSRATQGIIVFDDLSPEGVTFGEPGGETYSPDTVVSGVETQACWHAATWDAKPGRYSWLRPGGATRLVAANLLTEDYWHGHFNQKGAPVLPQGLQDRQKIHAALKRLWQLDDASTYCLAHGDAHIGNTYVDPAGKVGFIDWQSVCLGPWSYDVAYFVGGALTISDRRVHERDILAHYLKCLAANGGPLIAMEDAWPDYVRHTLHGFLWALTPSAFQPLERVVAMADRYLAAMIDHDTLSALGL